MVSAMMIPNQFISNFKISSFHKRAVNIFSEKILIYESVTSNGKDRGIRDSYLKGSGYPDCNRVSSAMTAHSF